MHSGDPGSSPGLSTATSSRHAVFLGSRAHRTTESTPLFGGPGSIPGTSTKSKRSTIWVCSSKGERRLRTSEIRVRVPAYPPCPGGATADTTGSGPVRWGFESPSGHQSRRVRAAKWSTAPQTKWVVYGFESHRTHTLSWCNWQTHPAQTRNVVGSTPTESMLYFRRCFLGRDGLVALGSLIRTLRCVRSADDPPRGGQFSPRVVRIAQVAQSAEATGLDPVRCGFDSRLGHSMCRHDATHRHETRSRHRDHLEATSRWCNWQSHPAEYRSVGGSNPPLDTADRERTVRRGIS